ncbi:SDR family NAD(P)-dependent oxidoreductase [Sphingobacterium sp.]|uniref:SDR family NAD(P)-dependent oxidoreductase n=1 Tax=Sphingobacterium sp. TaxID=341027 RepID=UPI00258BFEC3|nr:SDR family NAD(P)-dependent oxidoreductase [Sphingobacterium sp.]WET68835.1 MAG: SDR family NAD(P)-dependent oxidoreductase [Sphingobacterium sp.]
MKKALVTGASGGIGKEVAKRLAAEGYLLTLVARNEEKLGSLQESLGRDRHHILPLDLTNQEDIIYLSNHLVSNKYDLLINNAGNGTYGRFVDIPLENQIETMTLNMEALVALSYAFLKHAKSGDALINIASILAHSSLPGGAVYAATKSFVANFSESLWYEFKNKGIFVAGFNPGAADSDFHSNAGSQTSAFPKFVVSSVQQVTDELINAISKRSKPRIVQGLKNRLMLFGFRFLSRKAAVKIMGKISPGMSHS